MKPNLIKIYTIGHGRHAWQDFLALLNQHEIKFLCDVRNHARSRWVQFNGAVLSANLRENGIGYEWMPECRRKNDCENGRFGTRNRTDSGTVSRSCNGDYVFGITAADQT